jgi:hypothetical protein
MDAIKEKRRVLERRRVLLMDLAVNPLNSDEVRDKRARDMLELDDRFVALADEEAKL